MNFHFAAVRKLGYVVALLVLAGCVNKSANYERTKSSLCGLAIQVDAPKWREASSHINEALGRGLTEQQCARLTGRFAEQQIAAVHRQNSLPSTIRDISNRNLCGKALHIVHPMWAPTGSGQFINEAKRRGFAEQQCARMTGRFTEQQLAALQQSTRAPSTSSAFDDGIAGFRAAHNKSVRERIAAGIASDADNIICSKALQANQPIWDYGRHAVKRVDEAKRRGLTEQQCAQLTRRFTEQDITAVHQTLSGPVRRHKFARMSNEDVCYVALNRSMIKFDSQSDRNEYLEEAKLRGLTEQHCVRLNRGLSHQQAAAGNPSRPVFWRPIITANRTDRSIEFICKLAINSHYPSWEPSTTYRSDISEAKRRGLTEKQCARLSGRFSEQQINAAFFDQK